MLFVSFVNYFHFISEIVFLLYKRLGSSRAIFKELVTKLSNFMLDFVKASLSCLVTFSENWDTNTIRACRRSELVSKLFSNSLNTILVVNYFMILLYFAVYWEYISSLCNFSISLYMYGLLYWRFKWNLESNPLESLTLRVFSIFLTVYLYLFKFILFSLMPRWDFYITVSIKGFFIPFSHLDDTGFRRVALLFPWLYWLWEEVLIPLEVFFFWGFYLMVCSTDFW